MTDRRCVGCWQVKDRSELIKITADNTSSMPVVSPNSNTFGRSAYLCYNKSCIEAAFKKNKLGKHLKVNIPNELKGQLLDELRNS
ncbi:MAG: YlxR family protein [Muribaculaceae bacterium]|nr:YlxR family protein [Muribaculaceae bacterium]